MSFAQGAPTQNLSIVASNIFVTGTSTSGNAFTVQQLGSGNVASFVTVSGSSALFINPAGNVGFGLTNPLEPFHIYTGNAGNPTNTGAGADSNAAVRIQMVTIGLDIGVYGNGTTWIQNRQPGTSLGTTFNMVMQPLGGNVGIGTASPGYLLDVNGTVNSGNYFNRATTAANSTTSALSVSGASMSSTSYNYILSGANDTANRLVVFVNGSARTADGGVSNVTIRNDTGSLILGSPSYPQVIYGTNVGIGQTNPAYRLDVYSTSSPGARFYCAGASSYILIDNDNAANQAAIQFNRAGTMQWVNYVPGSSTDLRWYNGSDRMTLNASGLLTVGSVSTGTVTCGAITSSGGTIQTSYAQGSNAPNAGQAYFYNPTNSTGQNASVNARIAGSASGSAYYSLDVNGVAGFSWGITGASQNLVYRASWDFSGGTIYTFDRSGNFTAGASVNSATYTYATTYLQSGTYIQAGTYLQSTNQAIVGTYLNVGGVATGTASGNINGSDFYNNGWFRVNNDGTGLYSQYRGKGVQINGASYGNLDTYGTGGNSWQGFSCENSMTLMHNGSTGGVYGQQQGWWYMYFDGNNTDIRYQGGAKGQAVSYGWAAYGTLTCNGNIISAYSDERLKKIEKNIENALDKVNSLNGFYYVPNELAKKYDFKDDEKFDICERKVGVSAQQVQKILPEIVMKAPFDVKKQTGENYLTVQYEKLVPLLIEAIKELTTRVKELEIKVNNNS